MPSSTSCILVVADPGRVSELTSALAEPFPGGAVEVLESTGGDDTIDLFESRKPRVVVVTASLEVGDTGSLIEALREMVPREQVVIVLVGDDDAGPIRTALDAIDLKPDRFVSRPLAAKALRFAVQGGLEAVARARGDVGGAVATPAVAVAVAVVDAVDAGSGEIAIGRTLTPLRGSGVAGDGSRPVTAPVPVISRASTDRGVGIATAAPADAAGPSAAPAAAEPPRVRQPTEPPSPGVLRARWEALADSIDGEELEDVDVDLVDLVDDAAPPLPPIEITPRKTADAVGALDDTTRWRPGNTSELRHDGETPTREPTLIIADEPSSSGTGSIPSLAEHPPSGSQSGAITIAASGTASGPFSTSGSASGPVITSAPHPSLASLASGHDDRPRERWSEPVLLSQLIDRTRDSSRELLANVRDDLGKLDDLDDDLIAGGTARTPPPHVARGGKLKQLEDLIEPEAPPELPAAAPATDAAAPGERPDERPAGRDFARQLRAKMSQMAQRLFQGDSPAAAPPVVDIRPRHDHHTEIDLAALGEEPALDRGVTEIESRAREILEVRSHTTSPGSWDTQQIRERGLPDSGEMVRGVSDAPAILARMFALQLTGRVGFRRDAVEKIVYFDQGRPVFASSNEPGDRMGELLVREGKITATQYERCQVHVAQSGRRMGEILVDFGYLKRRELLPAVRRHVEDILYSLFGWDYGVYHVTPETTASAERIRLSRHPASLVLEGIRRKLGRATLDRLLGPASTVIEIPDRDRVGSILNVGDLAPEERAALTAFDGQADLAQVARVTGVDVADVLPLAWGLCVLGLANARRTEPDPLEESTALVGETDLAIDRERVRARYQLVNEADYFALLGVRRDATAFEIRRAYQSARRDFAADCFPVDLRRELARELEDIAVVLDEAFRVLRDDQLRQSYLTNLID